MKVLIVDDDERIIKYLVKRIRQWGYNVAWAENGTTALKILTRDEIDLILLDVYLRETTAVQLIPELKMLDPDVNIITMTGQNSRDLEMKIRSLGILYYMEKPIESNNLKLILEHMNEKN